MANSFSESFKTKLVPGSSPHSSAWLSGFWLNYFHPGSEGVKAKPSGARQVMNESGTSAVGLRGTRGCDYTMEMPFGSSYLSYTPRVWTQDLGVIFQFLSVENPNIKHGVSQTKSTHESPADSRSASSPLNREK